MDGSFNKNASVPPWLREDGLEDSTLNHHIEGPPGYAPVGAPVDDTSRDRKSKLIHWSLKAVTMALCVLMCATAVIGLQNISGVDSTGKIFVASYMFFFSILLFVFESMDIKHIESIDFFYKRNFGFLYNIMGRALFLIFIAFLSFGLGDPEVLTLGTGGVVALFGLVEVGLYLKYPEVFEQ